MMKTFILSTFFVLSAIFAASAQCVTINSITCTSGCDASGNIPAGGTATFCVDFSYSEAGTNWIHGVTMDASAGMDMTSMTGVSAPGAICVGFPFCTDYEWKYFSNPSFVSDNSGQVITTPGYYVVNSSGESNPGDNLGYSGTGPFTICFSITADNVTTNTPGTMSFSFTSDSYSGSYTNNSCGAETSTTTFSYTVIAPLPVELISFKAIEDGEKIQLEWSTATEFNNDHFLVERSSDNVSFEPIGKITGSGNSTQIQNYAFTDERPLYGQNYYRLKQVDRSGEHKYSKVLTISNDQIPALAVEKITPVPAKDHLNITYVGTEGNINLSIFDYTGRKIKSDIINHHNTGRNVISYDISDWKEGIYFYILEQNGQTAKGKIVKAS